MKKILANIIEALENKPLFFRTWLTAFSSLVFLRTILEIWQYGNFSASFFILETIHTFLFFLTAFFIFALFLSHFLGIEIKNTAKVLLFGFLLILLPPLIDHFFCGADCWRTYEFLHPSGIPQSFLSFFEKDFRTGITPGVKAEIFLAIFLITLYALVKTEKCLKSLATGFLSYVLFFILATLPVYFSPSILWFDKIILKNDATATTSSLFLSPQKTFALEMAGPRSALNTKMGLLLSLLLVMFLLIYFFFKERKKFCSMLKNARYPQLLIHWGLVVIGLGLAYHYARASVEINFFNIASFILLEAAVACAWLASVVFNDIADENADKFTPNKIRPLITGVIKHKEFLNIGWTLFIASVLFSAIINIRVTLLIITYQAVAWIYSARPLRLKRLAFISTFLSSIALIIILFCGYIFVSPANDLRGLPLAIVFLLIIAFTFSLPVKDLKDVEGDKKEGVHTIPVLFGEQWGKIIIGSGISVSFLLSVVFLNERNLFWWAAIFGALSFWLVLKADKSGKIKYHRLPWWIFGLVFVYGLILVKIVFL